MCQNRSDCHLCPILFVQYANNMFPLLMTKKRKKVRPHGLDTKSRPLAFLKKILNNCPKGLSLLQERRLHEDRLFESCSLTCKITPDSGDFWGTMQETSP